MLNVFIPLPSSRIRSIIPAGSGIVGEQADAQRALVHYEPPSPAVNIVTFADRVFHAADRMRHDAPTSKRCAPERCELVAVGTFDEQDGRVLLDPRYEALLADWLCQRELDAVELGCKGTEHFARRRELRAAMSAADPALARWAAQQARRAGLLD